MNTEQIAELYIKHAADFRELLDLDLGYELANCDGVVIGYANGEWLAGNHLCSQPLAVAAITEVWRQRLEGKHGAMIRGGTDGLGVLRKLGLGGYEYLDPKLSAFVLPNGCGSPFPQPFASWPEAIVAAVEALANEKRAKAKEQESPRAYDPVRDGPDPLYEFRGHKRPDKGPDSAVGPDLSFTHIYTVASEDRIRQIVRQELDARINTCTNINPCSNTAR